MQPLGLGGGSDRAAAVGPACPACLQENPKSLPLRLRPQDLNCHANFGGREPSRRLLLKLTRPAAAAAAAAGAEAAAASSSSSIGSWSAEVVATLPYTYRFTHPADYQYVAHDSRPVDAQGEAGLLQPAAG
jgi:hypothetical protein